MTPTPASDAQTAPPVPHLPPHEMLKALEPAMIRATERHVAPATEWFPH